MNRTMQRWVAAIAAGAMVITVAILGFSVAQAEAAEAGTARVISNAQFTWSMNDEAGGGAFFGSCNFLTAGVVADAGGSTAWSTQFADQNYKTTAGNVSILKDGPGGTAVTPTWATKCQDANGSNVKTTTGSTSNNSVVYKQGEGWFDEETGAAQISWKGSFTVVFYGGMTYWSISDPVLQVRADGSARMVAKASGYGADMDDPSKWQVLPDANVELMNFNGVEVSPDGFSAAPTYVGTAVTTPDTVLPQTARNSGNAAYWGSFPQSFIDYQVMTGQAAYWYTSGGSVDRKKPAHDLQITSFEITDESADPTFTEIKLGNVDGSVLPPPAPKPNPTPNPNDKPQGTDNGTKKPGKATSKFTVKDAVLRWGLNDETSSAAFFGGCNYLVAGKAPDAGSARVWSESDGFFTASKGKVEILKPNAQGTLQRATWANKCQDRNGQTVTTSSRNTTESVVSMKGGKGEVDPKNGTAKISWKGSFTVAFYGGMTYWHVSDPVLEIKKNGTGTLKGVAGGFGSDMDDMTKWVPLKERTITLANLRKVDVTKKNGITITPEFLGVSVKSAGTSHSGQAAKNSANSSYWGSFPQSFIDFQIETGQSAYWYTSGGARDWAKPASAITISYDAKNAKDKAKKQKDNNNSSDNDGTNNPNPVNNPPRTPITPPATTPGTTTPATPAAPQPAAPSGAEQLPTNLWAQQGPVTTMVAIEPVALVPVNRGQAATSSDTTVTIVWAGIGAALLAAAVILFIPGSRLAPARARRTKP